jgi:hypothetical protein
MYILDASGGEIQLGYEPVMDTTYNNGDTILDNGEVVKIKGSSYVMKDADVTDNDIELGPAIKKSLSNMTTEAVEPAKAVTIVGDLKMAWVEPNQLYLYEGNSLLETITLKNVTQDGVINDYTEDITSDVFKAYRLYAWKSDPFLRVTMVEKAQLVKASDGQEGVFGYNIIKINNADFPKTSEIILVGDPISLIKGDTIDIPDTYFQAKFTIDKKLDLKRKETETVVSGTTLKSTTKPGNKFLDEDKVDKIVVSAVAVVPGVGPTLDIVDEATADKDMNLVLIGGPVANTLTAELVTNGKSTVDWYASEGDIEVISSAFKTTKYAIIVAGKNREATKAAADALAAAL